MNPLLVILGATAAALVIVWAVLAALNYLKYRGTRLVTCPENQQTAAVEAAAGHMAAHPVTRAGQLRLKDCSRWPEKRNCGQECLSQVEANPENCLVWNIVSKWYEEKECAVCHKPLGQLEWHAHRPALMDPRGRTVKWNDVPAERLPEVLTKFQPVCWDCHIAETFRREHPDLIVDRSRKDAA